MAACCQNFGREADGFSKIAGQVRKRGEKKITEAVPAQFTAFFETMLKEFRQQCLIFRQRDDAIADITWR